MTAIDSIEQIVNYVLFIPLWILAAGLKLGLVTKILFGWKFPLSKIPGPRLASWTRLWWIKTLYNRKTAEELVRVDKEYGPVVRISPNSILASDPETTRKILAVGSNFSRSPWFDSLRLEPNRTNVVSEREPKKHQQLRSILSAGLSGKDVSMEPTIDEHISQWISMLNKNFTSENSREIQVDLSQNLPFLTLDIITHLCLGESFQCLEKKRDPYGFLDALKTGVVAQQYISSLLEIKSFLFFLGRSSFIRSRLFPNTNDATGIGQVMKVIRKAVERKQIECNEKNGVKRDMLESFLSRGLTLDQASSELVIVLTSGVGSTSYAAQGIIRCIVANPDICRALQHEIDDTVAKNDIKTNNSVNDSTISQMPYLQACKFEGLRMYPPIFQLREREVPPEGSVLHGYRLPGGTFVGLNSLATQLHPVYGDSTEEFHPKRWLIDDEVQLKEMCRNLELVFGYGASKCLGVNMAHLELNKIIFEFFRNYDASFVNPEAPWKARGDFVLSDFNVKIRRREV